MCDIRFRLDGTGIPDVVGGEILAKDVPHFVAVLCDERGLEVDADVALDYRIVCAVEREAPLPDDRSTPAQDIPDRR